MISHEEPLAQTISILIADDHELTRFSLKLAVQQQRETKLVGVAKNGKEAVELVSRYHPDVVVLDLQMPVMNGLTASQQIKRFHPNTKVIAYTSVKDPHLTAMLEDARFDAFCDKETGTQELLSLILQLGMAAKKV